MKINWTINPAGPDPVIKPGQLNPQYDAKRAGACHVLQLGDEFHIFYWGTDAEGHHHVCRAAAPVSQPNQWRGLGALLSRQVDTDHNHVGPSFPFVLPIDDKKWFMYTGCWGKARADGKLPNTTTAAVSEDAGETWQYATDQPLIPLDKPWDQSGTGSVWANLVDGVVRMYYTSLGEYFNKPEGVRTGHGDVIPRIGIGYCESTDGLNFTKTLDSLMVSPRGFDTEPYEYISSKPCVIYDEAINAWRMWLCTFGYAYRIRSLISKDGLTDWQWQPSGIDGEFGIGETGAFDDVQRTYPSVLKVGDAYHCWFSANGFGTSGMGYAVGHMA